MAYARMGYGDFKKKTVKVTYPGDLVSGKKVVMIDLDDYLVLVILINGMISKNEYEKKLWDAVKSNQKNMPLSELVDKIGFDVNFEDDKIILVPKK